MNMKKIVASAAALSLTAAVAVGGTLAWMTANDTVTNTFTVGNITMTLDEAPVDANGNKTDGARVEANSYHIVPGGEYDKDPTVHVGANSDACYVFVKVENGLSAIEDTEKGTIASQIEDQGWEFLQDNVYYKEVAKSESATDLIVFSNLYISSTQSDLSSYASAQIKVTAYAIQQAGFEGDAEGAYDAVVAAHPGV